MFVYGWFSAMAHVPTGAVLALSSVRREHRGVTLSVSPPADDVAVLDEHARACSLPSRSAALQHVLQTLRRADLEQDYVSAWDNQR